MESSPFLWYLPGKMAIFMGYVSLPEGKCRKKKSTTWRIIPGPLPNGRTPWLINGGDPNQLLTGMILQVKGTFFGAAYCLWKKSIPHKKNQPQDKGASKRLCPGYFSATKKTTKQVDPVKLLSTTLSNQR